MDKTTPAVGCSGIVDNKYLLITSLDIIGHPPRKSNSRRLVTSKAGKLRSIRSSDALDYESAFIYQANTQYSGEPVGSLAEHLCIEITIYYRSRRADLSAELILDCLEKAGVVANDRFITEQHLYGFVDKNNPRIRIRLYKILGDKKPPF